MANGVIGPTKTRQSRSVPIVQTVYADLSAWRLVSVEPADDRCVFPNHRGAPWSGSQFRNWRARVWRPTLESLATEKRLAHLKEAVPYDCRGSFVSLHLRAGDSPLEVARWASHSPQVMFSHCANVIEELVGEPRIAVEEQIKRARDTVEDKPAEELDELAVQLFGKPKVEAADPSTAAKLLYGPSDKR